MQRSSVFLVVMLAVAVVACEEEGPAIREAAANEAPIVGTELEEDNSIADDIPIGEPEVMDVAQDAAPADIQHGAAAASYGEIPPASRAVQETPSLPGGN